MKLLRSKITKRILGIVLVMWCTWVFFNGYVGISEPTHAQEIQTIGGTSDSGQSFDTMGLWEILNMVLKIIYLLLWPLLVVAGIALDNTLVYASIFHLDAPLWKFWNMMKNFANFTLWFMVLFAIIKSLLTNGWAWSAKDEKSPLGIIKKTLIAGVLIQASRFLMAAVIDVSTVATYAVGWLPLSVLKNTDIGNQKILSVNSSIDLNKFDLLNKEGESFRVRYSTTYKNKNIKISPCRIEESLVIGREFGDPEFQNSQKFDWDPDYEWYEVCVLFWNQLVMWKEDDFMQKINNDMGLPDQPYDDKQWYESHMDYLLNLLWWNELPRVTESLVNLKWWSTQNGFQKWSGFFAASDSLTISSLINKSKWFVGPLVTMYSSLLNFAQLTDTNVSSISETSGIFLIKTWVAIALFFPLLALAVVLIARIWLLWLYIVASPFIVIKETFKDFIKIDKLDKYLSIKSILGIIFAPVVTVAALSISLIFMTALINGFKSWDNQQISSNVSESLQIEPIAATDNPDNQAFRVGWSAELEFKNFDWWWSLDWFSWLVVNFFAIGLLWTILFAAIKANALGKSLGAPIQSFGANVFRTLPILPIGEGGAWVGIDSTYKVLSNVPERKLSDRQSQDLWKVQSLLYPEPLTSITKEQATPIISSLWGLSSTATRAEAENIFTEKWITNPSENITANNQAYFEAIKGISNEEERQKAISWFELVAWANWYTTMMKTEATKAFTNITDQITKDTTESEILDLLTTNKASADIYFKDKNDPFVKQLNDDKQTKITITANKDANDKTKIIDYTITKEATK